MTMNRCYVILLLHYTLYITIISCIVHFNLSKVRRQHCFQKKSTGDQKKAVYLGKNEHFKESVYSVEISAV